MIRTQKLYGGKVLTFVKTAGDSIRRVEAICLDEKAGIYEFLLKDWNELSTLTTDFDSIMDKRKSLSNLPDEWHDD
jgi:hypothetical protein